MVDLNLLASSMVGDGLNLSPYKEWRMKAEAAKIEIAALRFLLNNAAGALAYWMPDETEVPPASEGVWDKHIKLCQQIEAVLEGGE